MIPGCSGGNKRLRDLYTISLDCLASSREMVGESGKEMEFGCRMGADGVGIDDGFGDAPDCSRIRDLRLAILEENEYIVSMWEYVWAGKW